MKQGFCVVIFDFDYTLADSSYGAMECINFALNVLNIPPASYKAVCQTIGLSIPETFLHLAGLEHRQKSAEFAHLFKERADEAMAERTVIYPTLSSTIKALKHAHVKMGIVSTKYRYRIEDILRREEMLSFFDVIVGSEDVQVHKPDPEGVRIAIERSEVSAQQALYVGDSVVDAETALRGKIPFVAVLTGVTQRQAFDSYKPLNIVSDLKELTDWLLQQAGQQCSERKTHALSR
jgi:phosphoglycolate phosphatase